MSDPTETYAKSEIFAVQALDLQEFLLCQTNRGNPNFTVVTHDEKMPNQRSDFARQRRE